MRQSYEQFTARDVAIAVVGKEDSEAFNAYWTQEALQYMALPNPTLDVLDLYGQEISPVETGRMPAIILIDRTGTIRYAHYGNSQRDIPGIDVLLEAIDHMEETAGEER